MKTRRKRFTHTTVGDSWTLEDVSRLDPSKSYKELSIELNRTEKAVGSKLQKLRILKETYSDIYSRNDLLDLNCAFHSSLTLALSIRKLIIGFISLSKPINCPR